MVTIAVRELVIMDDCNMMVMPQAMRW